MFQLYCALSNPESFPLEISPFVLVSSSEIDLSRKKDNTRVQEQAVFYPAGGGGGECIISVEVDAGNYLPYRQCPMASSHLPSFLSGLDMQVP